MTKPKSRPARWSEAVSEAQAALASIEEAKGKLNDAMSALNDLKSEYEEWKDNLPENLQGGTLADKLDTICGLDFDEPDIDISSIESTLDEAESAELPRGFGRD